VDTAALVFAVVGVGSLLAALLPRLLEGRPASMPMVFLAAGMVLGVVPGVPFDADPTGKQAIVEHFAEVVVIISLMGAGLALDRRVGWRRWRNTWRLLALGMPLTILAVYGLGLGLLGLAPAAAMLLGASLAPTDPVLAGEVQVGEPATEPVDADTAEDEVRFSLTSEAGLNDALAFPFVYAAVMMATLGADPRGWIGEWVAVDLLYRLTVGLVVGVAVGRLLARTFFSSRRQELRLSEHREGFVAIAATFLSYGATELAHGYGFLAVFVTAVTVRSSERFHGYHVVMHHFVEQVERLLTVLVLLLVGMALTDVLLGTISWQDVGFAALVLLVVRPLVAGLSLLGGAGSARERVAMSFFGVRGIGSVYYVAFGIGAAEFAGAEQVLGVVALVVAGSVVLHGLSAGPVMSWLDRRRDVEPAGLVGRAAPSPRSADARGQATGTP
jgi:sodium/hydrogen antiporter